MEDSDDDDLKKDDGSHARMLQNITGMPREAFEGNVVSGYRRWIMYVIWIKKKIKGMEGCSGSKIST